MEENQLQLLKKEQTSLQLYSGLTAQGIANNIERINENFPNLSKGFYKVLCERVRANKVSDYELTSAVNHVIETCKFPNPMVAEFIDYIKKERPRPEEMIEEPAEMKVDPEYEKEREDFIAGLLAGDFDPKEDERDRVPDWFKD